MNILTIPSAVAGSGESGFWGNRPGRDLTGKRGNKDAGNLRSGVLFVGGRNQGKSEECVVMEKDKRRGPGK